MICFNPKFFFSKSLLFLSSTLPFIEEASFELLQHHSGPTERLPQTGTLRLGVPWRAKQDSLPAETTVQEGISLGICPPGWHACPFLHTGCAPTPSHWGQGSGSSSTSPPSDLRRRSEHLLNFRFHGFGNIDANSWFLKCVYICAHVYIFECIFVYTHTHTIHLFPSSVCWKGQEGRIF